MLAVISEEKMIEMLEGVAGERRDLEFKESFEWKPRGSQMSHIQATVVKTILGFCNTPRGGIVIIGVTDNGASGHGFVGIDATHKNSYDNTEALASLLGSYASSPIDYEIGVGTFSGEEYIVITVSEFRTAPVQCAKEFKLGNSIILQKDALYARSTKSIPSTIIATPLEMREIITMAEERDEQFIQKFMPAQQLTGPTDTERYDALDGDFA